MHTGNPNININKKQNKTKKSFYLCTKTALCACVQLQVQWWSPWNLVRNLTQTTYMHRIIIGLLNLEYLSEVVLFNFNKYIALILNMLLNTI